MSDNGLISRIYVEFLKLSNYKKPDSQLGKGLE